MERVEPDLMLRTSLRKEHHHRYAVAAQIAAGKVVDCACGIGYGSELLLANGNVSDYTGIDPDASAVSYARERFAGPNARFLTGTLEKNRCKPASADTFVMFETLEHTVEPAIALSAVAKVLKHDGLLIGSVPSAEYEGLCESVYGPNEFHLQRFTAEALSELLSQQFQTVALFAAEFVVGTLFRPLDAGAPLAAQLLDRDYAEQQVLGSILFLAGSRSAVEKACERVAGQAQFHFAMAKTNLDAEEVEPIRKALNFAELSIQSRDEAIASQGRMLEDRWDILVNTEGMVRSRDGTIEALARQIDEQGGAVESITSVLSEQQALIQSLTDHGAQQQDIIANVLAAHAQKDADNAALVARLSEIQAQAHKAAANAERTESQLRNELKRLSDALAALEVTSSAEISALKQELEQKHAEYADVVNALSMSANENGQLQRKYKEALVAIAKANTEAAAMRLQLAQLQSELAAIRSALASRLPTYVTLKDVKKRWGHGQEDVFPVAQFEKLWSDLTALPEVDTRFVVVPRLRGQQLKDQAQLDGWLRDGSAAHVASLCDWG